MPYHPPQFLQALALATALLGGCVTSSDSEVRSSIAASSCPALDHLDRLGDQKPPCTFHHQCYFVQVPSPEDCCSSREFSIRLTQKSALEVKQLWQQYKLDTKGCTYNEDEADYDCECMESESFYLRCERGKCQLSKDEFACGIANPQFLLDLQPHINEAYDRWVTLCGDGNPLRIMNQQLSEDNSEATIDLLETWGNFDLSRISEQQRLMTIGRSHLKLRKYSKAIVANDKVEFWEGFQDPKYNRYYYISRYNSICAASLQGDLPEARRRLTALVDDLTGRHQSQIRYLKQSLAQMQKKYLRLLKTDTDLNAIRKQTWFRQQQKRLALQLQ